METTRKSWRCLICGYIHVDGAPPAQCPVCGSSPTEFEPYQEKAHAPASPPSAWRCLNCEHIHHGSQAPDHCPVCGAAREKFESYSVPAPPRIAADDRRRFVIIGSGIAGLSAAEELRKNAPGLDIQVLGNEGRVPYYRLNLTRYLAGEVGAADLPIHPPDWYEANGIRLHLETTAQGIDRETRSIHLSTGAHLPYDRLILAMGAHPFLPPLEGHTLGGVRTLRTVRDADHLLASLGSETRCICIGGGILGLETAGALAHRGAKVLLLEGAPWLMPRQLNRKGSLLLKKHLDRKGIEVRENVKIKRILGATSCEGVELENGERFPATAVTVTAGVRPNTTLARRCSLEVNQGIVVDNHLRSSDPAIYAAGDVTEHYGMVYGLWHVAQYQGRIAALNALGIPTEFGGIPRSNLLKVLDIDLFSIGEFMPRDGSFSEFETEADGGYSQFVLRDGRMVGSIIIGDMQRATAVKKAVEQGVEFPGGLIDSVEKITARLETLQA